jgi:hypothetical protein
MLVSLDLYPEDVAELVEVEQINERGARETDRLTRQVLVLDPRSRIAQVELLYEHPDESPFGFQLPAEPLDE